MCDNIRPVILVHGGAGDIPDGRVPGKLSGVKLAVKMGLSVLQNGGGALEAAEAAVRSMEDDENFNAGYGSVLTIEGNVEMSASVMHGENLTAGAVGYLKNIAHPISVAKRVMEKTPHVLLVGDGATRFAEKEGFEILPDGSLVTEIAKKALEDFKEHGGIGRIEIGEAHLPNREGGTVGAVALDKFGNVAAATSTGGITGKYHGRVGDTPQIGSGTYADNQMGAVSTTGHGESILKFCLAHSILTRMQILTMGPQEATLAAVEDMTARLGQTAGAITLSPTGEIGIHFSSKRMSWAYNVLGEDVIKFGIEQGQCEEEKLNNKD